MYVYLYEYYCLMWCTAEKFLALRYKSLCQISQAWYLNGNIYLNLLVSIGIYPYMS